MANQKKMHKINTDVNSEKMDIAVKALAHQNFEFSISLYNLLKPVHSSNLHFSPLCLTGTLELLANAAGETTQQEILKALKIFTNNSSTSEISIHEGIDHVFSDLHKKFATAEILAMGSSIIAGQTFRCRIFTNTGTAEKFDKEFKKALRSRVAGDVKELDFHKKNSGATVSRWLQLRLLWVEDDPNTVTRAEFLSTPNGIVVAETFSLVCHEFGGQSFDSELIKNAPFYVNKKKKVEVKMMEIKGNFSYGYLKEVDAHALILPLQIPTTLCMICLIPKERTGILRLEKNLRKVSPAKIMNDKSLSIKSVQLFIPRFAVEVRSDLTQSLKQLGMSMAFEKEKAEFPEISSTKPFSIIKMLHVTLLEVHERPKPRPRSTTLVRRITVNDKIEASDEEISQPAPKKKENPRIKKGPIKPPDPVPVYDASNSITVRMDHPFLYQVVHMDTNTILIFGCLKDPSDATNICGRIDDWELRQRRHK